MKSIILVGAGKACKHYIELFSGVFNPIMIADNSVSFFEGYNVEKATNLSNQSADVFYITTSKFQETLFKQLVSQKINADKIYTPNSLNELLEVADQDKFSSDMSIYKDMYDSGNDLVKNFELKTNSLYPCLSDYRQSAGSVDSHYFYMDIIVANLIIRSKPEMHYDIGSRVDGFISHLLAADVKTTVIDIRPLKINNINIAGSDLNVCFLQGNAENLKDIGSGSITSLSSLHAVEHFGLGRYGDPVNPMASFVAMEELQRILAKNGILYFAVPVGRKEKLCFNAHRIFAVETILNGFPQLQLQTLFLIHDGRIREYTKKHVTTEEYKKELGDYDCGIFIFKKH